MKTTNEIPNKGSDKKGKVKTSKRKPQTYLMTRSGLKLLTTRQANNIKRYTLNA